MLDLYKMILKALHIQVVQQETKHKTLSRIYENIAINQYISRNILLVFTSYIITLFD